MVTYVIVVYNIKNYIKECVDSVINNSDEIEVIIVDDGSTDGSGEICDQYLEQDKRIKVIHQENQGVSVARNVGLQEAKGKWICFVDGDDVVNSKLVNKIAVSLNRNLDVAIMQYSSDINWQIEDDSIDIKSEKLLNPREIFQLRLGLLNSDRKDVSYYKKNNYNFHAPWGKLYRREFLIKNHLFYTKGVKKGQDMLFNFDVYKKTEQIQLIPAKCYFYRIREDSVGHKYNPIIIDININLINEFRKRIEVEPKEVREEYYSMVVRQFAFCMLLDCCHPLNKKNYIGRKKDFLDYREMEVFEEGFRNTKLSKLRFLVRIFSFFAKNRIFWGMCVAAQIKNLKK